MLSQNKLLTSSIRPIIPPRILLIMFHRLWIFVDNMIDWLSIILTNRPFAGFTSFAMQNNGAFNVLSTAGTIPSWNNIVQVLQPPAPQSNSGGSTGGMLPSNALSTSRQSFREGKNHLFSMKIIWKSHHQDSLAL